MELGERPVKLLYTHFNYLTSIINNILTELKKKDSYDFNEIEDIINNLPTLNWYIPPSEIKNNIFDKTEKILYDIDNIVDWINPYSIDLFEYSNKNGMLYPYVHRWFNWTEYNEEIILNKRQKEYYLFVSEPEEEQLFDIDGNKILTLEGYFND